MWLTMSKAFAFLLSPLTFAFCLFVLAVVLRIFGARAFPRFCMIVGFLVVLVSSSPLVARYLVGELEKQYPPVPVETSPSASMVVVLGGAIARPIPPRIAVELVGSSDRVLHAFRLYRAGKAPKIFLTAGNLDGKPGELTEADHIAELLGEWGVPEEVIVRGGSSRTTRENALEVRSYLEQLGKPNEKVLLVTSAIHMPRAVRAFRNADIDVIPSVTDISANGWGPVEWKLWIPSSDALNATTRAWHEHLGMWMYDMRGWL